MCVLYLTVWLQGVRPTTPAAAKKAMDAELANIPLFHRKIQYGLGTLFVTTPCFGHAQSFSHDAKNCSLERVMRDQLSITRNLLAMGIASVQQPVSHFVDDVWGLYVCVLCMEKMVV